MCQVGVWWGGKASLISYPNKRARRGLNFIPTEPAAIAVTALFDREEAPEQLRKKVHVVSINAIQEPSGQQALPGEPLALLVQSAFPVEPLPIQQTVQGEPLDQSAIPGEPFVQPVASWLTQLPQGSCPRRAVGSTSCPSGAICSASWPIVGSTSCPKWSLLFRQVPPPPHPTLLAQPAVPGEPLAQPAVPVEPFVPSAALLLAQLQLSQESLWLNQLSQWSHLFHQLPHCWLSFDWSNVL